MNTTNNQLWAIACCFNEEAGITTFIEAVLAQPSVDRLLLIDDGSRDNTTGAIRQWMEAQPQAPITLRDRYWLSGTTATSKTSQMSHKRLAPIRLIPFSYFCTC